MLPRPVQVPLAVSLLLSASTVMGADLVANNLETVASVVGNPNLMPTRFSVRTLTTTADGQGLMVPHSAEVSAVDGDFAITYWFRLDESFTGQWRIITFKGNAADERNFSVWMRPNDNRLHYRISTNQNYNEGGDSSAALEVGQWNHIAYVRRRNQLSLYINGRLDSFATLGGAIQINDGPLYMGDTPWHQPALGGLGEVNIYQRTLSQLEIRSLYKSQFPDNNMEEQGLMQGTPALFADARTEGQGLRFDSPDDGTRLPNGITTTTGSSEFSVAFWLRLEGGPTGSVRGLVHKGSTASSTPFSLWLRGSDNRLEFRSTTDTNPSLGGVSNAEIPLGQWTHIAYVKRNAGNRLELFIDGVRDTQVPLQGNVVYNDGPLHIGATPWSGAAIAAVDDVSVYNYRLEASDAARFSGQAPRTVAEAGRWGPVIPWPQIPVSASNLPDGRILTFSGSERTTWPTPERTYSSIWDPATGEFDDLFQAGHNMFCAHLAMTASGQVFVNGGRNQTNSPWVSLFRLSEQPVDPGSEHGDGGPLVPGDQRLAQRRVDDLYGDRIELRQPGKVVAVQRGLERAERG